MAKETKVVTTPELVDEAMMALYRAKINIPKAAEHCGMTKRELKMTFREFLKHHPPDYEEEVLQLNMLDALQ